jgi:hypothetical protein
VRISPERQLWINDALDAVLDGAKGAREATDTDSAKILLIETWHAIRAALNVINVYEDATRKEALAKLETEA